MCYLAWRSQSLRFRDRECDGVIQLDRWNYELQITKSARPGCTAHRLDSFCIVELCARSDFPLDRGESENLVQPAALAGRQQLYSHGCNQPTGDVAGVNLQSRSNR